MRDRLLWGIAILVAATWGLGSIVLAYSYVINPGGGG
jgi:hypothetical protein